MSYEVHYPAPNKVKEGLSEVWPSVKTASRGTPNEEVDPGWWASVQIILTPIQVEKSQALAAAHYHQWAETDWRNIPAAELAANRIAVETYRQTEPGVMGYGIENPYVQWGDGVATCTHTTNSGRVTWEVFPDGEVNIEIHRPSGKVFDVTVHPEYGLLEPERNRGVAAYQRHLDALLVCLDALGVEMSEAQVRCLGEILEE